MPHALFSFEAASVGELALAIRDMLRGHPEYEVLAITAYMPPLVVAPGEEGPPAPTHYAIVVCRVAASTAGPALAGTG